MDIELLRSQLTAAVDEMRTLSTAPEDAGADWEMSDKAKTRFDELDGQAEKMTAQIEDADARRAKIEKAATVAAATVPGDSRPSGRAYDTPNINRKGDPWDLDTLRFDTSPGDLVARAQTALETDDVSEGWAVEAANTTLRSVKGSGGRSTVARLALATGSDAYRGAFAKLICGQQWALTDGEKAAVARAQSLTDASGGFAVPFTLDPTVVLTNDGTSNPMREIARVVQITTNEWNGVTSAGATAAWSAEGSEAADGSITLAQPKIPVYTGDVFIPFSIEIGGDWANIDSDLRMVMADARGRLEANGNWKGTGSAQTTGVQTALDGTSSEIAPATAEVFAIADVYNLQRQLPARYRMNATWAAALGTYNAIRQFDTSGGGNMWTQLGGGTPEQLLGRPTVESVEIDDSNDINAAATADNFILYYGDFSRYVLVDRVGMTVELIPHLMGSNQRPTGQRGFYGYFRTGGDVIDNNAFRVLSIATTA